MTVNNVDKFKLTPEGDGWQVVDFTIVNPTSSPVQLNLFDVNSQTPIPSDPNLLPPTDVIGTLPTGVDPLGLALSNSNFIYVVNSTSNSITVIDANISSVVTTITGIPSPTYAANCPTNNSIYVTTLSSGIYVINCNTNTISTIIPDSVPFAGGAIAYNKILNKMYAISGLTNVKVINCATNTITANVAVSGASDLSDLCFNEYSNTIYIVDTGINVVFPLDCATNIIGTSIPTGGTGSFGCAYDSFDNKLYVANTLSNDVSVINGLTNTVIPGTIPVGTNPEYLAYDTLNNQIYVSNPGSNNISVIDCTSDTVLATISSVTTPEKLIYTYSSNSIYATNTGANTVTIIAPIQTPYIVTTSFGSYFQFLKDQAVNPKKVRQIVLIAPNSQIAQTMNFVYTTMTGINFQRPIMPNLAITQWMPQNTIAEIDFSTKKANQEFALDEHTFLQNYTLLANTTLILVMYYKDLVRSDMLEMANEIPLLHCSKLELDNCSPDAVEKVESQMQDFGEPIITVDQIISIEEEKLKNKK